MKKRYDLVVLIDGVPAVTRAYVGDSPFRVRNRWLKAYGADYVRPVSIALFCGGNLISHHEVHDFGKQLLSAPVPSGVQWPLPLGAAS